MAEPRSPAEAGPAPGRPAYFRSILAAVAVVTTVVLVVLAVLYATDVLLLVFAAILLAIFLRGLGDELASRSPLSGGWSLALVVLALAGLLALGFWLGGAQIAGQVAELRERVPDVVQDVRERIRDTGWGGTLLDRLPTTAELLPRRSELVSRLGGAVSSTLGLIGSAFVVVFIGLFLAAQPQIYVGGLLRLVPPARRARADEVLGAVGRVLRYWLLGKVLAMVVIGVATAIGLWLLEIPLALTLGVIAAALTFIPNIGPILSAVPAVLLGLAQSPGKALAVVLLYLGLQTVESYLLTPIVQQRTVSLPPALTLTVQLMLGVLAGGLGLLVATPLAAAALVLVQTLYIQDILGDPIRVAGQHDDQEA